MIRTKSYVQSKFDSREYLEEFNIVFCGKLDLHLLPAASEEYYDFGRRREPDLTIQDRFQFESSSECSSTDSTVSLSDVDEENSSMDGHVSDDERSDGQDTVILESEEPAEEKSYKFKCKLFNDEDDKPCKFVPHKLVDLCRLFFIRSSPKNPYFRVGNVPFLVIRFLVKSHFEITLTDFAMKKKYHFTDDDCLCQLAQCLLSFNRHIGVYCTMIEGFLFSKLRSVIEKMDDGIAFEIFANCSVNPRGCYAFRNRFGVFFICFMKKDMGHQQPFYYEAYFTIPSIYQHDPAEFTLKQLGDMASILGRDHAVFQAHWKFWSGLEPYSPASFIGGFFLPAIVRVDFIVRDRVAQVSVCGKGLLNCRIFQTTCSSSPIEIHMIKGGYSLAKFVDLLMDSKGKLFDCNYSFDVQGLGFYQALFTMFARFPDAFPIVEGCVNDRTFCVYFNCNGKTFRFKRLELQLCGKFSKPWVRKHVHANHQVLHSILKPRTGRKRPRIDYYEED